MQTMITQSWLMWITRGVIAFVFGILAFVLPFATISSLVILCSAFIFVDGVFAFSTMFMRRDSGRLWWSAFFEALTGILVGLTLLLLPGIAVYTLLYLISVWAIVTGVFEMITAFRMRKIIEREWALGFAGLASLLFGLLILAFPNLGVIASSWTLGSYALVFGLLMINTGMNLKRLHHKPKTSSFASPRPV